MQGQSLFDEWIGTSEDEMPFHLDVSFVGELIPFLLKLHLCHQFCSRNLYLLHLAFPTEMLFLNIHIQSHLRNALEIEEAVLIGACHSIEAIGDICNASSNHFDLQVGAVLLLNAFDEPEGCRICLLNRKIWHSLEHDISQFTPVAAILEGVASLFLIWQKICGDPPEAKMR